MAIPWKNRDGDEPEGVRARRGTAAARPGGRRRPPASSLFFPHLSASIPTGKLNSTPANGEMAAISPITVSLPEREFTNRGSTGLFDIVVERDAEEARERRGRGSRIPAVAAARSHPLSRGKVTVKVEPASGRDCTATRPLYPASTRRTVARPSPVPGDAGGLVVLHPVELLEYARLLGVAHADAGVHERNLPRRARLA